MDFCRYGAIYCVAYGGAMCCVCASLYRLFGGRLYKKEKERQKGEEKMNAYKKCLPYQLFGKRLQDLNLEEKREYKRIQGNKYYTRHRKKFTFECSFLRQQYGQDKRVKSLPPEQLREYNRIKQREHRSKEKIFKG